MFDAAEPVGLPNDSYSMATPLVQMAVGVVMASYRVGAVNAQARLLARAMQLDVSVIEVARRVTTRPDRVEEVMDAERPGH